MLKYGLLLIGIVFSFQSHGVDIHDFDGAWKEVGYRCVGDNAFKPRPWPSRKNLTIAGYNYVHRVEFDNLPNCTYVESSGSLSTSNTPGSRWLNIQAQPTNSVDCYKDTAQPLVDDFILDQAKGDLWITFDDIEGETYLIIAGDIDYVDSMCGNPIVERIYAKSSSLVK